MTTCSNCSHAIEDDARFCPSCGTRLVRGGEQEPLIGKTFNAKYRVLSKIGSGGMGTVYLGEHIGLRKKVALKVLRPDLQVSEETLRRFQREGIAAGKFSHPNAIHRMEQRAIRQRWELSCDQRAEIIQRQYEIAVAKEATDRAATNAARVCISAERQNQADDLAHDDLLARQPQTGVTAGINVQQAQVILTVPDNNRGPNRIERD